MPGFNAHIIILGVLCDQIVIAIALGSLKNYLKVPKVRFFIVNLVLFLKRFVNPIYTRRSHIG